MRASDLAPVRSRFPAGLALLSALCAVGSAAGQSALPAVFVGNNGNLEGSVSSFRVNRDGTVTFVAKYVTGQSNAGTNVYGISLSPSGRWLVTSHATASDTVEQLTLLYVRGDATLEPVATLTTPDSPLAVLWLRDDLLAVTRTSLSQPNLVIVYRVDAELGTITQIDSKTTGTFTTSLALHPGGQFLYAQDSNARTITAFRINPDGTLTFVNQANTFVYPLGLGIAPDGSRIYAGGGISGTGKDVTGCDIDPVTGAVSLLAVSPIPSPDSAPKQVVIAPGGAYALVAHGSAATCRVFTVDSATGMLTATNHFFDVGIQGALGSIAMLGSNVFITDNFDGPTGLYSFKLGPGGTLTQNGPLTSTQGTAPFGMAVWAAADCPGDTNGDRTVDQSDLALLLAAYNTCSGDAAFDARADLTRDCCVDQGDLATLLANYLSVCP